MGYFTETMNTLSGVKGYEEACSSSGNGTASAAGYSKPDKIQDSGKLPNGTGTKSQGCSSGNSNKSCGIKEYFDSAFEEACGGGKKKKKENKGGCGSSKKGGCQ